MDHETQNPTFSSEVRDYGIVLIFDEVVTGFRLALGGAQEYYRVTPDLAAYGKALGGGFPIGALAGRTELMQILVECRLPGPSYVWSASTGGGNPVSAVASLATLDVLSASGVYPSLHQSGELWRGTLRHTLSSAGEASQVLGDGPLVQVAFSRFPVTDSRSWQRADRTRARAVMLELLPRTGYLTGEFTEA